jgi:hypothetical protein
VRVVKAVGAAAVGLVAGVLVGVVGVLWHHADLPVGDDRWPVGLVLVVLLAGLAALAVGAATSGRTALLAFVLGVVAVEVVGSASGPGGDALVVDDTVGQVYLLGTGFAAVVAMVLVRRVRRSAAARAGSRRGPVRVLP